METQPPFQVVSGQRQLAAIMFTDAVGYSAQMHDQEVATLNRIERDTEQMRRIVSARSGTVLKSTGDGLLISFSSAVEAVACAVDIQQHFRTQTSAGVRTTSLRYRVGIHLGDVFVGQGDVMGDGVNIAARLVSDAPPGGIHISETVHAVVKNKLPLHTQRMGPQRLKNIKEPIIVYRVLLDEPAAPVPVAVTATAAAPVPPAGPPGRSRTRKVLFASLVVLGVAAGTRFLLREYRAHEEGLGESQSAQAAFGELAKKSATTPGDATPAPGATAADFAAFVTRTPATLNPPAEALPRLQAAEKSAGTLLAWLPEELRRYTKERPLVVTGLGDPVFQGSTIFTDANHLLYFAEGGAFRRRNWAELKEPVQAAIIVSALRRASPAAGPELWQGAAAFAYLHGLPEMAAALPGR